MSRARVLVGFAVLASFAAGIATGWALAHRTQPPTPPEPPPVAPAPAPVAAPPKPERGPELFGVIQEIRRPRPDWLMIWLACRTPTRPEQRSPQSEYEGELRSVYVIDVRDGTIVRQRAGDPGELAEQQIVSVWCRGPTLMSKPPRVGAEWVVIEPSP